MTARVNFADASVEPTGEQLQELSHEAFAGVAERQREALAQLRARVAALRVDALAYAASLVAKTNLTPR